MLAGVRLILNSWMSEINKVEMFIGWVGRNEGIGEVVSDNMP